MRTKVVTNYLDLNNNNTITNIKLYLDTLSREDTLFKGVYRVRYFTQTRLNRCFI